jgi:hypothetical protein
MWNALLQPLAPPAQATQRCHVGFDPCLVNRDKPRGRDEGLDFLPPAALVGNVRPCGFFGVKAVFEAEAEPVYCGTVRNLVRGAMLGKGETHMAIDKALLDQLLAGRDAQELFAKDGLLDDLKKALSERILNAELDEHLGSEREAGIGNRRNGTSKKTVLTGTSKLSIAVPRDREGSFDPQLIAKYQRRFGLATVWFLGERLSGGQWLGVFTVLLSVLAMQFSNRHQGE